MDREISSYKEDVWAQEILVQHASEEGVKDNSVTVHNGVIRKKGRIYIGDNKGGLKWSKPYMTQVWVDTQVFWELTKELKSFFIGLKETVFKHVLECDVCQMNKS